MQWTVLTGTGALEVATTKNFFKSTLSRKIGSESRMNASSPSSALLFGGPEGEGKLEDQDSVCGGNEANCCLCLITRAFQ